MSLFDVMFVCVLAGFVSGLLYVVLVCLFVCLIVLWCDLFVL